jgi:predicted lipid-binding transport protein (Tim44 family)
MNNPLVRLVLFGLLLMLVVAPFAGLAPLMLVLLGFGACSVFWSLVQAFFTPDRGEDKKAGFEPSRGKS